MMDERILGAVQIFLETQKIKGGIFPWIPIFVSMFGLVLVVVAFMIWYFYSRDQRDREGINIIAFITGLIGLIMFIIVFSTAASQVSRYICWSKSPDMYAFDMLLRRLGQY